MIDWDKHPKAAHAAVTLFNEDGESVGFKRIERPTQKTVADAVEQQKHWKHDRLPFLAWNSIASNFRYGSSAKCAPHEQYVCTRAEFEAYVKEQESSQASCLEGEKWTYIDSDGDKCMVIAEHDEMVWVTYFGEFEDNIVPAEELKPIKPKMTKAQAFDILYKAGRKGDLALGRKFSEIQDNYDITD